MRPRHNYTLGFLLAALLGLAIAGGQGVLAAMSADPEISIPQNISANANNAVLIPVNFTSNGSRISTLTFSINYDETYLTYEPTWADSFTFNLPADTVGACNGDVTDTDGEIDCVVFNQSNPLEAIPDGVFLTLKLRTLNAPDGTTAPVIFSQDPAPFFGDTDGNVVDGIGTGGSVLFGPGAWNNYLPLLVKQLPPTLTPTATPTQSPTPTLPDGTPTPTNTSTPTPTPCCTEVVVNGGFEDTNDGENDGWGWELPATAYSAQFTRAKRYEGEWSMLTGITDPAENTYSYSSGEQTFTIPSSATSATLTFWNYPISSEAALTQLIARLHYKIDGIPPAGPQAYDLQYVAIQDITTGSGWDILFWQISNASRWQQETLDLSDYIGHTVQLRFTSYNDGYEGVTAMYVDNVSVQVCDTR